MRREPPRVSLPTASSPGSRAGAWMAAATPPAARVPARPVGPSAELRAVESPRATSLARWALRAAITFGGYVGAVVALTWPLASVLSTHLPHTGGWFVSDLYYVGWALSWQTHALTTDPARFADGNIYGGVPLALFYGTPGFGLLPIFAPIFAATANTTLALDVAFLASLALTATTIHLVVVEWTGSRFAGVAAGSTLLTTRAALDLCGRVPQYTALAAIPLIVALLARDRLTRRTAVALAGLIALQALTDLVYVALPMVATVAVVAIARLADSRSRADGRRIVIALFMAGCALLPVYAGYLAVRGANPDLAHQTVWKSPQKLWIDLSTFLPAGNTPMSLDALAFLPAVAGALAIARARAAAPSRAWRQAALWFGVSFAMSWVIPVTVPALHEVLLATMVRDVVRLGFVALVGFGLLTGLGFAVCVDVAAARVPAVAARAAPTLLLVLWLSTRIAHAPFSLGDFPIAPGPVPGPEAAILRRGTGPVLELPVGDPDLETASHVGAMYRSTAHWRTLVNGYSSYYPRGFRERMEAARQLPTAFGLDVLRRETGLTSIVVHADGLPKLTIGRWQDAIERGALRGVQVEYVDDDVLVATVMPPE